MVYAAVMVCYSVLLKVFIALLKHVFMSLSTQNNVPYKHVFICTLSNIPSVLLLYCIVCIKC